MPNIKDHHIDIAIKKAKKSDCRYSICALGFNKKNELIYKSNNRIRFDRYKGGEHAEMRVMLKAGPGLHHIFICRVNNSGDLLPIEPCDMCRETAEKNGVKIYTIKE